jgi:hypothetical protein
VNSAVAITDSLGKTAIILAAIWAGRGFLLALVPQLRVAAPKDAPRIAVEAEPAVVAQAIGKDVAG